MALILFCLMAGCASSSQKKNAPNGGQCITQWQQFELSSALKGKVLSFQRGLCGYIMSPSVTIVVTTAKDTVRVLQLCGGVFNKSDAVLVKRDKELDSILVENDKETNAILRASNKMTYGMVERPGSGFDRTIKKTCFGAIEKIN